jgi:hypothetical protein
MFKEKYIFKDKHKKILFILLIICLLFLEIIKENRYLNAIYPVNVKNFNYMTNYGIQADGNFYTQDFEQGTYSSPRMSHFSCNFNTNKCIESTSRRFLDIWVIDNYESDIILKNETEIKAIRETPDMKETITFNIPNEEVTITQIPTKAKTGDKFSDIGHHTKITKLVDGYVARGKFSKENMSWIDTPLLKLINLNKK